ncbi:hypothetical protein D5S17_23425 [Pseudonocardiaceae bacterium YIM PH 21723]|nr:hypothetical protein D5S17_23425 [Pseudonocardiaceae bacterium YIM PH 21723]
MYTTSPTENDPNKNVETAMKSHWPRWSMDLLAWIRARGKDLRLAFKEDPSGAAELAGTVIGVLLMFLIGISAASRFMRWLSTGDVHGDVDRIAPISKLVASPVHHWITAHTQGVPISTHTAEWLYVLVGGVIFLAAISKNIGGQLMWLGYGAATTYMVWAATAEPLHRPVTAALVVLAWGLLSLLAVRRPKPNTIYVPVAMPDRPRTKTSDTQIQADLAYGGGQ